MQKIPWKHRVLRGALLVVLVLSGCAPVPEAEKRKDILMIVPGKGIREISLGASPAVVLEVMGAPANRTTFEQEQDAYTSSGFRVESQLEFTLGFDFCFEYLMEQNRSRYPIYKIFFQHDKIHIMTFSAFVYEPELWQNVYIASENLKFYSKLKDMQRVLGTDYLVHPLIIAEITDYPEDGSPTFEIVENYAVYDYLEKGISVIVENDAIVSVLVYPPLSSKIQRQYKNSLKAVIH